MENYTTKQRERAAELATVLHGPLQEAQRVPFHVPKRLLFTLVSNLSQVGFLAGQMQHPTLFWATHNIQMQLADKSPVSSQDVRVLKQGLKYISSGGQEQVCRHAT